MKARTILKMLASLSCIAAAFACSSSSKPGFSGGGDGGGEGGAGDAGDGGSSSGGPLYFGTITAEKTAAGAFDITGDFFLSPDGGVAAGSCSGGTMSGSCCYQAAVAAGDAGVSEAGAEDAGSDGGTFAFTSAGTLTISDGTTTLANINPAANGGYGISSANNNPTVKWTPGDTLTVAASGAVVDSFTGSLVTVVDLAGITPALSLQTAATVPLDADLVVRWTASTASTVRLLIIAAKGLSAEGTISCSVADSTGTVTVPMALLTRFTTGDTGIISLTRQTVSKATDANTTVDLVSTTSTTGVAKFQ